MYTGSVHSISISIDFNLLCDQFYYGAKCEVFCQPHNDTRGHYTCDEQGHIVCNHGYTGEQTNCTTRKSLSQLFIIQHFFDVNKIFLLIS